MIPRSRFKQMVEGASRTTFSSNFFAGHRIVAGEDPSIARWFEPANRAAAKDRERELLAFSTWTIHAHRHARKRLSVQGDLALAVQDILGAAHSVAHTEIIRRGEVWEQEVIYRATEGAPELFRTIYLDVLAKRKSGPPHDVTGYHGRVAARRRALLGGIPRVLTAAAPFAPFAACSRRLPSVDTCPATPAHRRQWFTADLHAPNQCHRARADWLASCAVVVAGIPCRT